MGICISAEPRSRGAVFFGADPLFAHVGVDRCWHLRQQLHSQGRNQQHGGDLA